MKPPPLGLGPLHAQGRRIEIEDRILLDTPFFLLHHYRKKLRGPQPGVLVVAPLSGHFGWLMRDLVAGLLPRKDVLLLEWKDAADIPPEAGAFGMDRNMDGIIEAVRLIGPGTTLVGVSQSAVPVLAATAVMAAGDDACRPCGLVLMGGFVETRIKPTAVEKMAAALPPGWFTHILASRSRLGRLVYPGHTHWLALARYMARHMATGGELQGKLLRDDSLDAERYPFLSLFSTLMDLPAEFAEENAAAIFREARLARGTLTWHGEAIDPAAIADVALMTIEGRRDDSSGLGQTLLAHALCHRIPDSLREHHIEDEAGHFGLFHGRLWQDNIRPEVETFIAGAARRCPVRKKRARTGC